jgi:hypothetical protein
MGTMKAAAYRLGAIRFAIAPYVMPADTLFVRTARLANHESLSPSRTYGYGHDFHGLDNIKKIAA